MSSQTAPIPTTEPIALALIPFTPWTSDNTIKYEDRLISRQALAHWLGISVNRLNVWAREGYGPKPLRIGGYKVAYRLGDVLDFLGAQSADVCPDVRRRSKNRKPGNLTRV